MEAIALEPVDALTVTMLVDNVTDSLLADQGPAKRAPMAAAARMPARFLDGGQTDDALRAEHGFSALVTVTKGDRDTRVLFDAGRTPDGMVENMRRLELSPRDIDIIVLSHGHWDHTTGMDGLARELGKPNLPVLIHPEFWNRRRVAFPGREPVELPTTSRSALQGAGFEIVEQRQPSFLLDGSLLVTGEVDRYVRTLTGEDRIHAVLGGFHLSGRMFAPIIGATCDAFAEFAPDVLVPAHCTGWTATRALAERFPDAFIQNAVGTRYEFVGHAPGVGA